MLEGPIKKKRGKKEPMGRDEFTDSNTAVDRLRSIVERIEQREQDKRDASEDITEIYKEGSSSGFDAKVLRQLVRIRKDLAKAMSEAEMLEIYMNALGMK